jgi:hypothetical protein
LTFESGSRLQAIRISAFAGCYELESICLSASAEQIEGGAFSQSGIRDIQIESGNTHFRARDSFLMDFDERCILHYFGSDATVTIPDYVEVIGKRSFYRSEVVYDVIFGQPSKVRAIKSSAFDGCEYFRALCIPASVTSIGGECFTFCEALTELTFEPGSQLSRLPWEAFSSCCALKSIAIPSSVEIADRCCLARCCSLETRSPSRPQLKLGSGVLRNATHFRN